MITAIIIILCALIASFFLTSNHLLQLLIKRRLHDEKSSIKSYPDRQIINIDYLKSLGREDITIKSKDNLNLHGFLIMNKEKSDKFIILVHGISIGYVGSLKYVETFYKRGFNILVIDQRRHGKSEGSYVGMGWHDRLDILKWIDLIIKENKDAKILLHGISMGAGTVMMVSGEELPENVKVIIEDCGYTSAKEQLAYNLKTMFKLPSFPILNFCSLITKIKDNYFISEASAIKQLQKAKVPILFIHGDKDKFVPFYMLDKLYNACSSKKDKLIIKDVGHAKSESLKSDLYWNKVEDFIKPYM